MAAELNNIFKRDLKAMDQKENENKESQTGTRDEDIFKTEEIKIEELAIDGICGVY